MIAKEEFLPIEMQAAVCRGHDNDIWDWLPSSTGKGRQNRRHHRMGSESLELGLGPAGLTLLGHRAMCMSPSRGCYGEGSGRRKVHSARISLALRWRRMSVMLINPTSGLLPGVIGEEAKAQRCQV